MVILICQKLTEYNSPWEHCYHFDALIDTEYEANIYKTDLIQSI